MKHTIEFKRENISLTKYIFMALKIASKNFFINHIALPKFSTPNQYTLHIEAT